MFAREEAYMYYVFAIYGGDGGSVVVLYVYYRTVYYVIIPPGRTPVHRERQHIGETLPDSLSYYVLLCKTSGDHITLLSCIAFLSMKEETG